MGPVIADTDILIEAMRGNSLVVQFLTDNISLKNVVITYITKIELIKGATNKASLKKIHAALKDFHVLYHNKMSAVLTVDLVDKYHLTHNIKLADASIAAIAANNNYPILTLNTKDFRFINEITLVSHSLKPGKVL